MTFKNLLKFIQIALLVGLFMGGVSVLQANTCEAACNKFADCVSVQHGGASSKQRATLKGGCMKTCQQNKAKTIACYNKAQNSCQSLWNCVQANYKR